MGSRRRNQKLIVAVIYVCGMLMNSLDSTMVTVAFATLGREFYRSPEWIAARDECLAAKGRICSACGSTDQINVDHIKPRSKFPELALEQTNLRPLCWPCNRAKAARY